MWHEGAAEKLAAAKRGGVVPAETRAKISIAVALAHKEHRAGNWAAAHKISPGEKAVWPALKTLGFSRNVVFPTATRTRYIPDFTHAAKKIVVEIDGGSHALPSRMRTDRERERYISGMGFQIVHFPESFAFTYPHEVFSHINAMLT
jgi:very-short-patch-repair endonuclease